MAQPVNVEKIFKEITTKFGEISNKVQEIHNAFENIGTNFVNSMVQVSGQIETLTKTLEEIMKVSDIMNVKKSIHEIVETFRKELDPLKIQKLMADLDRSVKRIKEQQKALKPEPAEGKT